MRHLITGLFLALAVACSRHRTHEPPSVSPPSDVDTFTIEFVEVPGTREFSGRMVARPVQREALLAIGLDEARTRALDDVARAQMASYRVREHVPQTDEYVFEVPPGSTEGEVAERLLATGAFQYVEPDWLVSPIGVPDDPRFGEQWHHRPDRMRSADGWDLHTGSPSVGVGICDTGVLTMHEDLQLHRLEGYNAVDRVWESQGGEIGPVASHGTLCTGCAAANGNNGNGVSGVGWNLSHRMLRVSNESGGGAYLSDLNHAARTSIEAGDRVASVSYSGVTSAQNRTSATYIKSIGGLLVWAAGNSDTNLTAGDRDDDDLIVAGATDENDDKASFSSYGRFVDVTAPGVAIRTTHASSNSSYASVSGTSFATPLTAGLCALIWSANPGLSPDQVEDILKASCDDLGASGVDDIYGYGRINTYEAMVLAAGDPRPPVAEFSGAPISGVAPLTVDFSDLSTWSPNSWSWDLGDGTSSDQHPSHTYTMAGTYSVSLTATNPYGSDTETKVDYITVTEPSGFEGEGYELSKNADFSTDDRVFSRDDTIHIRVWSDRLVLTDMRRAEWELKDADKHRVKQNLANHLDRSFTASFDLSGLPSNATVWTFRGKIEDNGRRKFQADTAILVDDGGGGGDAPVAAFAAAPTSGAAPLSVSFIDRSTGAPSTWSWEFGDGGTSSAQDPTHVYANAATYAVTLTVENANGSDRETKTDYITVTGGGGGFTGEGFKLSTDPTFSDDRRVFSRSDTLHVLIWSDEVDFTHLRKAEWELKDTHKHKVKQNLTNRLDRSFTASFDLSGLPSGETSWTWKGKVEDDDRNRFQATVTITVD